jgi:Protein of unknown function (DUF3575)
MKKIITGLFLLSIATNLNAQTKNAEYRIKTNPLSPFVAVEQNINLSLEKVFDGEKNPLGFQASFGYIYDWQIFSKNTNISLNDVNGFVVTGEFRSYDKQGFYFAPYLQYKNIKASYNYVNTNSTSYGGKEVSKSTYSAGVIGGYFKKLSKSIATEVSIGLGFSNKNLYENGKLVDKYKDESQTGLILLEQTGRLPQFIFTYKLIYILPHNNK